MTTDGFNSTFRIAHPQEAVVSLGSNEKQELKIGNFKEDGSSFKTNVFIYHLMTKLSL